MAKPASAEVRTGTPAIRVKGLAKVFGSRKAVDGVSFELPQGAFLSVFGANGAGKTTLVRMLATLARPSAGSAELLGIDLREHPDEVRGRVGLISHAPMLYPDLTAEENLLLYGQLYGVGNPEARAAELLAAVGLKHRRLDRVRTFSRGMSQRLAIARALVHDPAIVLLDEPYSGLDPHAAELFDGIIERTREGRTFVMVSHDLAKGYAMCTHALVMAKGKAAAFGAKEQFGREEFFDLCRTTVGTGVS